MTKATKMSFLELAALVEWQTWEQQVLPCHSVDASIKGTCHHHPNYQGEKFAGNNFQKNTQSRHWFPGLPLLVQGSDKKILHSTSAVAILHLEGKEKHSGIAVACQTI
jgi:hypothetical protein